MTNVVGISALQELRKYPGFEEAIIAGGFCRDSVLEKDFKDLDIFIPCTSQEDFVNKVEKLLHGDLLNVVYDTKSMNYTITDKEGTVKILSDKELFDTGKYTYNFVNGVEVWHEKNSTVGNFRNLVFSDAGYREISPNYIGKYDCSYMGFLDVDIIGYQYTPMKDFEGKSDSFGEFLVRQFQYGMDMIYYDGTDTVETKEFQNDRNYRTATLLYLDHMDRLPAAIGKYFRLKEKYPDIQFKNTVLELKKKDQQDHEKKYYTKTTTATNPFVMEELRPQAARRPRDWDNAWVARNFGINAGNGVAGNARPQAVGDIFNQAFEQLDEANVPARPAPADVIARVLNVPGAQPANQRAPLRWDDDGGIL